MIDPQTIYHAIRKCGVDFFTGVPDSLLKEFCACVTDYGDESNHIIAANEGGSVALAAGHHLATGKCGLVYLQNSGLGNTINPLVSLADPSVYAIPMLLMIGWRGEPGVKDEPQHVRQGEITVATLEALGVPHVILETDEASAIAQINAAHAQAMDESRPVAIIVRKGAFAKYKAAQPPAFPDLPLSRERALEILLEKLGENSTIVSTTGKTSREVFEIRANHYAGKHDQDFLTVGSMGHCSQIALGIALSKPEKTVVCLDGDGAALMQMGGMAIAGQSQVNNFIHVLLNNGAHESVGGQPTVGMGLDFRAMGESMGYDLSISCEDEAGLNNAIQQCLAEKGKRLLEITIAVGSRGDLGRPTLTPRENKEAFQKRIQDA